MAKLWAGRFKKEVDEKVNDFNSSISFDARMYAHDIKGSMAHASMLGECGIIDKAESSAIISGLEAPEKGCTRQEAETIRLRLISDYTCAMKLKPYVHI